MKIAEIVDMGRPRAARATGWFRFFVPLDGMPVACELKISSGVGRELRLSLQQSETLDARPRLCEALTGAVADKIVFLNLLLCDLEMPWATLICFANNLGLVGAIIEAAEMRRRDVVAQRENHDCA